MILQTALGTVRVAAETPMESGTELWLGFRPEAVEIGPGPANAFHTRIAHVSYLGEIEQYRLELPGGEIVRAFEQNPREVRQVGEPLAIHIRPQNFLVLRA
jgi:ABC-type Fe3+/spermidine/putrescine transport system ATPase subunit